jgi:hypothetical protein
VDEDRLGQLVSTHPVDNKERWVIGAVALVIFAGMVWLLVHMATQPDFFGGSTKSWGKLLGLVTVPTIGSVVVAFVVLFKALRGGRRERIEVYEHGLSQVARGKRRTWTWREVTQVYVHREPDDNEDAFLGGRNFRCTVTFTNGDQLKFNGLTRGWETVCTALAPSFRLPRGGYVGVVDLRG